MQLLISLFNLFIECLIFDFELFKINQVQSVSELFLLLEHLLFVGESVPQRDVLQSKLIDLLILLQLLLLLFPDVVVLDLLARATVHRVLRYTALQVLELRLNLLALRLLLV